MKKTAAVFCFVACMVFSNVALATIWTAQANNLPFKFGSTGGTYSTTLSLFPDGFSQGDTISLASLVLDFDNGGILQSVYLDHSSKSEKFFNFGSFGVLLVPQDMLNDGVLALDVTAKDVSFLPGVLTLESVWLTAFGCDNTPVPEPSTLMFLGAALFGFAVYAKLIKCT